MSNTTVKILGKLFLSGEWSILSQNHSCIVLPIQKYLKANISHNSHIIVNTKDINLENLYLNFDDTNVYIKNILSNTEQQKFLLAKSAIKTALKYLTEKNIAINNFKLSIDSEISKLKLKDGSYTKIGLGSSAATIVATIATILKFHNLEINSLKTKNLIFKLSSIAHYFAQNKVGSCADVACCSFGKPIVYKRFDPTWLIKEFKKQKTLNEIVQQDWPDLEITPLMLPKNIFFLPCFVGYSASTEKLIPEILKDKEKLKKISNTIDKIVQELIPILNKDKLNQKDQNKILYLIGKNRKLLRKLHPNLETKELTKLIKLANTNNSTAKFSGAGAGDCGIAICFNKGVAKNILNKWKNANLYPFTQLQF
jgi:phosphomevalonate kinase